MHEEKIFGKPIFLLKNVLNDATHKHIRASIKSRKRPNLVREDCPPFQTSQAGKGPSNPQSQSQGHAHSQSQKPKSKSQRQVKRSKSKVKD